MDIAVFDAFCAYLYKKRWLLIVNFVIVCAAAGAYTFLLLKKEYSATVTFLPPTTESGMSALSQMNLSASALFLGGGAAAEQVEVVFNSNATKRKIIDKFNLIKYFELEDSPNQFVLAVKRLKKYAILDATDKGGLGMTKTVSYNITCYHPSPDTAKMMVDFTFGIVDSVICEISIDKAQRNRIFIEKQIAIQNEKMDSILAIFQTFQNTHKAYDVPEQAKLSLQVYADLKSIAILNELKIAAIKNEFIGQTHEMAELKRNQRVYETKLKEYEAGENPNVIPSLDRSSKLFPEYAKMLRDIEVQNQLILLLTKEFEQARLQEARDVSPLIIVDPSFIPEYKSRPKRMMVLLTVIFAENMFLLGILAYIFYLKHVLTKSERFNAFVKAIKQD